MDRISGTQRNRPIDDAHCLPGILEDLPLRR
jgi:hypothetical protein